ncbi:MAG: DEAD/DEAH box helicase [Rickettsiales bacterium]
MQHQPTAPYTQLTQQDLGERLRKFIRPNGRDGALNPDILGEGYALRAPQVDLMDAATQALLENRGSGLFVKPPRTGKTLMFGTIAKALKLKTIVLAPNKDLVDETYKKFHKIVGIPEKKLGYLHSDVTDFAVRENALDKDVLVTTYHTFRNLVEKGLVSPEQYPFIIADEVHRANGKETRPLMRYWMDRGGLVQGWTATDTFADGSTVSETMFDGDPPIHETTFHEAAKNGEIAPTRNIIEETDIELKINSKELEGEDFSDREASRIVKQNGRDEAAIAKVMNFVDTVQFPDGKVIENHFCNLPQIWYCAGVDHAKKIAKDLNEAYKQFSTADNVHRMVGNGKDPRHCYAAVISGETPTEDYIDKDGEPQLGRKSLFKAYEEGTIRCLVSADLLVEGYDFPHCELTVMLRPTRSPRIAVQAGARSTGLNEKDPYKVGYVMSFVDKGAEYATFGEVVGGLWHAPDNMRQFEFAPSSEPRVRYDRTDLPSVKTHYTTRDYINFTERQRGVKVLQRDKPEGFAEAHAFLRRGDYRRFVDFSDKLQVLFQEFERQYNEHQKTLPEAERYTAPFTTRHGIEVVLANNVSGGQTLLVNQQQMEEYVEYTMMPEPLLEAPRDGFVFLRDVLKGYHQNQKDYMAVDAFEQRMMQHYSEEQRFLTLPERHKDPVSLNEISMQKARVGRRNVLSFEKNALGTYLEQTLHLSPKAPAKPIGFLNPTQIKARLKQDGYAVSDIQMTNWLKTLQVQYNEHLASSGRTLREADVWTNPDGIVLSMARGPEGNLLVAARADAPGIHDANDIVAASVERLGLKKTQSSSPLPPLTEEQKGAYIPFANAVSWAKRKHGDAVAERIAAYGEQLETAYDSALDGISKKGKTPFVFQDAHGIHTARARGKDKSNLFYLRKQDINKLLRHADVEVPFKAPEGYVSYVEALEVLTHEGLNDYGNLHTLLQLVELEYVEAEKALPVKDRHRAPIQSQDGIRTVFGMTKDGPLQLFNREDLIARAPEIFGLTTITLDLSGEGPADIESFTTPHLVETDRQIVNTNGRIQTAAVDRVDAATPSALAPAPVMPPADEPALAPNDAHARPTNIVCEAQSLDSYMVRLSEVPDLMVDNEVAADGTRHICVKTFAPSKGYPREMTVHAGRSQKAAIQWAKKLLDEASERFHTPY